MHSSRILSTTLHKRTSNFLSSLSGYSHSDSHHTPSPHRSIFSTSHLDNSWVNKIKGVFTGNKTSSDEPKLSSSDSFTLLRFVDQMKTARRVGAFKQYIVGRSSEATFADAFEKQESIIRYLGGFDSTGENLQVSQKQEAAKHCRCTISDVENALAKFTWAREAHFKMEKLKAEGKPIPTNIAEVQKLMGSTPFEVAQSNLAKSGQISRNALCPCGSKKRYKQTSDPRTGDEENLTAVQKLLKLKVSIFSFWSL
ncbi:hypothetical protein ACLB2K_061035 [Fragaria x ananassa]